MAPIRPGPPGIPSPSPSPSPGGPLLPGLRDATW
jgi:hypothetical protein